jgi:hypothetical protein
MFKRQLFLIMIIALILVKSGGYVCSKEYINPAQMDTKVTYIIKTTDKEEYIGRFSDQDSISIRIITEKRLLITIQKKEIITIDIFDKSSSVIPTFTIDSQYWFENPNASRYFISASAYNLKKGQHTYQNTYLGMNSFNFGISDKFSLSTGFELFSTFIYLLGGDFKPSIYVSPKCGFKVNDNFHLGGGIFYANHISELFSFDKGISYIYCNGTYGTLNNNLTIGLGWAGVPLLTLCGQARLSEHCSLVTENWFSSNLGLNVNGLTNSYSRNNIFNGGLYTYGLRFIGESVTFDVALMNNPDIYRESSIGYPYLDFVFTP